MGGDSRNDDGARVISSQDCKTDCMNDSKEGRRRVMGVGLSRRDIGGYRDLSNKGLH